MLYKSVFKSFCHAANKLAVLTVCALFFTTTDSKALIIPFLPGSIAADQTICAGSAPNAFTSISPATPGVAPVFYQWQQSTQGINSGFTNIAGATGLTYAAGNLSVTTYFRRTAYTAIDTANTPSLTVTVTPLSVGGTIYLNRNSCRGSDLTILTLVGNVGNVIRWESSTSFAFTAITTIPNTTNELTLSNFASTTYYRAIVQSGTCPSQNSSIVNTVANPTVSNGWVITPPPGIACGGTNSFVFTLVAYTGTILRWESSPSPSFNTITVLPNTANQTQYTATNLNVTTYYRAVTSTGSCAQINSVAEGKEIIPPSVGGTIAGSDTVCSTQNSSRLKLSAQVGNILRWESSPTSNFSVITTIANTTDSLLLNNILTTTYYRAVVKRGTCPEAYSSTGLVYLRPKAAIAGTISGGGTYCSSATSIALNLTAYSVDIVKWQSADDSLFTVNVSTINVSNSTLNVGRQLPFVRYYRAIVGENNCTFDTTSVVKVIVVAQTVAGIVSADTNLCTKINNINLQLTGNVGNVLHWQSSLFSNFTPSITIANTTNTLNIINVDTSTYYRAIVQNGNCNSTNTNAVFVGVNTAPVGGTLSGSDTICASENINNTLLTLNAFVGSISKWQFSTTSDFSSNVSDINISSNTYTAVNLSASTYYRVIVTNGFCSPDTSSTAFVKVNPLSAGGTLTGTSPFNPNVEVCSGINSSTLMLSSAVGTILKWQSSPNADFSLPITDIANTSNSYTAINLVNTTYYRVIVKSGICENDTSNIKVITVFAKSDGGNMLSDTVCIGINATVLRLQNYVGTIVKWEQSSTANFSSGVIAIANTSDTLLVLNLNSTNYYRAIVKSGVCSQDTSIIAFIKVDTNSEGGTISGNGFFCKGYNSTTLSLTGNVGNIIEWQSATNAAFTGVVTSIPNTLNLSVYTVVNLTASTYFRVVVQNGNCTSASSNVKSLIMLSPFAVAGTISGPAAVCFNSSNIATLTLIGTSGSILKWESSTVSDFSSAVQTINNTTATLNISNLSTIMYYRVIVTNGPTLCYDTSAIKIININEVPIAGTLSGSDTICENTLSTIKLNLSAYVGYIVKWQSSTIADFSSQVTDINISTDTFLAINLTQTTYYRVVFGSGVCDQDTSNIVVIMVLSSSNAGTLTGTNPFNPNVEVCSGINSSTLMLSSAVGTILKWQSSPNADFSLPITDIANTSNSYTAINLVNTTYYRVIVKSGVCENDTSNIKVITVFAKSDGGNMLSDTVCIGINATVLRLQNYVGTIVKWEQSSTANFSSGITTIANTSDTLLVLNLNTTNYYRAIVKSGICSQDTSIIAFIKVDVISNGGNITGSDTVCAGINATVLRLQNYVGIIVKWEQSSTANFSSGITTIANTSDTLLVLNLNTTNYYRAIVKNGVCSQDTSIIAFIKVISSSINNSIISPIPDTFSVAGNPNPIIGSIANSDSSVIYYQWQVSVVSDSTDFNNISLATHQNYDPDTITQTSWYRRIAYHTICVFVDTSNVIQLRIIPNGNNFSPKIGIALAVLKPIIISNGAYQIEYIIKLKNYGNTALSNIRLVENLSQVIVAPSVFNIIDITADVGLSINNNFDGVNNFQLLDPALSNLEIAEERTIRLKLNVQPNLPSVKYVNQIYTTAFARNMALTTSDTSVNGNNPDPNNDGNPIEQSPTYVELEMFVPSGFSPNGDNKNDEFIIVGLENYPNNRLEIYNRWGNIVFEQAPYDNKWKGTVKNSSAIVFGDGLLPSGTYFYLLDFGVPGVKQLSGYIVIRK